MADARPRYDVETRWGVRIAARDGVELSANLWLPVASADRASERFPVILEMIPYGKDSWRRNADVARGEWLARRGYALCRLDVRGTGSSGGVALDEYTAAETRDGYDAVEWLASQPWCTGAVGMWGISYGGFTAIQVAMLRPPHLRAIVPIMATDDRYTDDVHYRGGCLTVSELSQYAVSQVAMNAMPPDPALAGPDWREAWRQRLEETPLWLFEWLRHQTDSPYWRQGSLAPDYDAIEVPMLLVGGWNDSYVDPVFRMQERCTASCRSIVGPWGHGLPDSAEPGPWIDWLDEMLVFFDRWLRDEPNGWEDGPGLRWFARSWSVPEPFPRELAGEWRSSPSVPVPGVREQAWSLDGGGLPGVGRLSAEAPGAAGVDRLPHLPTLGTSGTLSWGAGGAPNGLARDLRADDARSLTYTSEPLDPPVEVIGLPEVVLHVSANTPIALVAVRLSDVAPDGSVGQVSMGVLNLTHRRSHAEPVAMVPDAIEEVRVPLRATGYRWAAGHRIRVSVMTGLWPILWPAPAPFELSVHRGPATPSRLVLPLLPPEAAAALPSAPVFRTDPPTPPDLRNVGGGDELPPVWRITQDVVAATVTVESFEGGTTVLEDGRSLYTDERFVMTAADADPNAAALDATATYRWRERAFETEIRASARLRSTPQAFELSVDLAVDVDGESFHRRSQHELVPRRLV